MYHPINRTLSKTKSYEIIDGPQVYPATQKTISFFSCHPHDWKNFNTNCLVTKSSEQKGGFHEKIIMIDTIHRFSV